MIRVGDYNKLKVIREVDFGLYLDDDRDGLLLPKRFVPVGAKTGDELDVFVYHDSEDRMIATTQRPAAKVGEMAKLKAVSVTPQGAFLDWGLMKDLFVPRSKQLVPMYPGEEYLVSVYLDERTGRVAATAKLEPLLSNDPLTVKEMDTVYFMIYRKTEIGYEVIINYRHTGILHFNEVYRDISLGDKFQGFIKKIHPGNKVDVVIGKSGYQRVENELQKILDLLAENNGYLPYNDKSDPAGIYSFFGMSKKTFKMSTGSLYKQRRIEFTKTGIRLLE